MPFDITFHESPAGSTSPSHASFFRLSFAPPARPVARAPGRLELFQALQELRREANSAHVGASFTAPKIRLWIVDTCQHFYL